jgi:hypothetical protein
LSVLKPGASSSFGNNCRNSLIVNFSNCCRVVRGDILLDDDEGSGASCTSSATSDDFLDVVSKFVQVGAVILRLDIVGGLTDAVVVAIDIGGNDSGEKALTTPSVVVVKRRSNDPS